MFDKVDFRAKKLPEEKTLWNDKIIYQEDIMIVNMYAPKNKVSKYMNQN